MPSSALPHPSSCPLQPRHWAGLRPSSPSGIPYVGRHPTLANLFVNAGHFRNGIVLGPASARLVAEQVLGRAPIVDPTPFRYRRMIDGSDLGAPGMM